MTIAFLAEHPLSRALLIGLLALAPIGLACAWQATTPPANAPAPPAVIVLPSPSVQFQQTVQQQQVRDQLQKSQLEQQLHQDVSDNAKRPHAGDPQLQQQLDQANRARQDRERAHQQDVLDRYQNAPLPRVVPTARPAPARSSG